MRDIVHYVISPTGLVHAIDCPYVDGIAFTRVHALRMGKRFARCCAADRVTPVSDGPRLTDWAR